MAKETVNEKQIRPRLRISVGKDVALGPGKVELLALIQATGSITAAAQRMGMSYMRAWTLIRTMNKCFRQPLVVAARGGHKGGGGAELTDAGRRALELYQGMDAQCLKCVRADWGRLQALLRA
jgi:molybdate transport system regulatory protein